MATKLELDSLRASIASNSAQLLKRETEEDRINGGWLIENSSFGFIRNYFSPVLQDLDIVDILKNRQSLVAIDLLASSGTLSDVFTMLPQEEKLGISASTADKRSAGQKESDDASGISHVTGNLLTSKPWEEIYAILGDKKADFILERGLSGFIYMPINREFYRIMARRAWSLLNPDGGIILAQTPSAMQFASVGVNIYGWAHELNEAGAVVRYRGSEDYHGKLLIVRNQASPPRLPSL